MESNKNLNGNSDLGPSSCHRRRSRHSNVQVDSAATATTAIVAEGEAMPIDVDIDAVDAQKQPMQWMERRDLLFAAAPSTGSESGSGSGSGPQSTDRLQQLPTERSRDNRTHEEKVDLLAWANRIATKYPYPAPKKDQSDVVEGTLPTMACVDLYVRRFGGVAQFERVALALGWTPPGGGSTCRVLSPPMSDTAQSQEPKDHHAP